MAKTGPKLNGGKMRKMYKKPAKTQKAQLNLNARSSTAKRRMAY